MAFEWDDDKAAENLSKHRVSFDYASRVFQDPLYVQREDQSLEYDEARYQALGMVEGRILFVAYTYRGENIRLISARRATSRERRQYYNLQSGSG